MRRSAWSMKFSRRLAVADVVMLVGDLVALAHRSHERLLIVAHQFAQHVARRHEASSLSSMRLQLGDMADRAQRRAADLAHALGDVVGVAKICSDCSSSSR